MSKPRSTLDAATETRVVAMIARGDTYEAIRRALGTEGVSIAISTISDVKKRNPDALKYIQDALVEHEANQSTKLLSKSRRLLDRKLDRALRQDEEIQELTEQYQSGEFDEAVFNGLLHKALKSELTVAELTSLTKEMFNQSQVEQGKPTSITENPTQAKENLKALLEAINNNDDKAILEAVFPDA